MDLAEAGKDRLRPKAEAGRTARVPFRPGIGEALQIGDRRAGGLEQGERLRFDVKRIERRRLARLPVAVLALAGKENRDRRPFALAAIAAADLEQPHRLCPAVEVAPRRRDKPGQ